MTLQRYKLFELASRFGGDVGVYLSDEAEVEVARLKSISDRDTDVIVKQMDRLNELEEENERMRGGLEVIKRYWEITSPGMRRMSATYRIACDALKGGE